MYAEFNKESIMMIPKVASDLIRYKIYGIPKIQSDNRTIASNVIINNAKDIFVAGRTHFSYMWVTDLAISFIGAKKVLLPSFLLKQLTRILDTSFELGYVPTCFSKKKSFNMPFKRQDNLPCLIHSLYHLGVNPETMKEYYNHKIKHLYEKYMEEYYNYETNLLKDSAIHDWMDTVKRPSSTFSNLFLLHMFNLYEEITKEKTPKEKCEKALLEKRWNGSYFIDYDDNGSYLCADANVPALYFDLFNQKIRYRIVDSIESSDLLHPVPMKTREGKYTNTFFSTLWSKDYHSLIWPHLGMMYLNGLKKMKLPYEEHLSRVDKHISTHKNFLEVLDMKGNPFSVPLFITEYNFSMFAGQYMELVS